VYGHHLDCDCFWLGEIEAEPMKLLSAGAKRRCLVVRN